MLDELKESTFPKSGQPLGDINFDTAKTTCKLPLIPTRNMIVEVGLNKC